MAAVYGIIFVFGLVIGSFISVLIYRIPQGESIVSPPSACRSCGSRLTLQDLIPVLSYIFLRGKCRHCTERIPARYLLVELITAGTFITLYYKFGLSVPFFAFAYLLTILIAIFFIDIDHRIIPNGLVLAGLAGGFAVFVYNCISPMPEVFADTKWWTPLAGLLPGSAFLLIVAIVGSLLYKTDDAMGMGDVKLMAPVGLFLGWKLCLIALFVSVILGGLLSLLLMVTGIKKRKDTVAFGPFIVVGTFITIMWGWEILYWYLGK